MPDPDMAKAKQKAAQLAARAKTARARAAAGGEHAGRHQAEADLCAAQSAAGFAALALAEKTRKADLARLHLAAAQLGMTDEDRRLLQQRITGQASAADMTARQRADLLAEYRRLGWRPRPPKSAGRAPSGEALAREPSLRKLQALLASQKLPWTYAEAILRRQRGLPDGVACPLQTADVNELRGVISALAVRAKNRQTSSHD